MEEVENYAIKAKITREDMAKMWSTNNLLVRYEREIMVWHHRLNHCYFKSLLRISKRGVIHRNINTIITPPPPSFCCLSV